MRKLSVLFALVVIAGFLLSTQALAQPGMKLGGVGSWGPTGQYGSLYNPATVEEIAGEVVAVEKLTPTNEMTYGVHLILNTDKETISVHLGPSWYIENQDTTIDSGDKIEVKGSRITYGGKSAIIAAEVKKGNEILILRDKNGFPVWAGWRRR